MICYEIKFSAYYQKYAFAYCSTLLKWHYASTFLFHKIIYMTISTSLAFFSILNSNSLSFSSVHKSFIESKKNSQYRSCCALPGPRNDFSLCLFFLRYIFKTQTVLRNILEAFLNSTIVANPHIVSTTIDRYTISRVQRVLKSREHHQQSFVQFLSSANDAIYVAHSGAAYEVHLYQTQKK